MLRDLWFFIAVLAASLMTYFFWSSDNGFLDRIILDEAGSKNMPLLYTSTWIKPVIIISIAGLYTWLSFVGAKAFYLVTDQEGFYELRWLALAGFIIYVLYYGSAGFIDWSREVMGGANSLLALPGLLLLFVVNVVFSLYALACALLIVTLASFWIVLFLPAAIVGVYSLFITSEVQPVALRHIRAKRPSDVVERELAKAIKTGLDSDAELNRIITELPFFSRFLHTLTYKSRAAKYREMRRLIDAQTEASRERNSMAKSFHQLERERRNGRR